MKRTRRAILSAAAIGSTTGCLGLTNPGELLGPPDEDGDGVADKDDDYPEDESRSTRVKTWDETYTTRESKHWEFWYQFGMMETEFMLTVVDGPPVDLLVYGAKEWNRRQDGKLATPTFRWEDVQQLTKIVEATDVFEQGVVAHLLARPTAGDARQRTIEFHAETYY